MRRIPGSLLVAAVLLAVAACGSPSYVRLRGTTEIHRPSCRHVLRAHPSGVVEASLDDGPPCVDCLREEALEWLEDQ